VCHVRTVITQNVARYPPGEFKQHQATRDSHICYKSNRMRVLHITGDAGVGGVETFLLTLQAYQKQRSECPVRHEFAFTATGPLIPELRQSGATVYEVGSVLYRKPVELMRTRRRLRNVLAGQPYSVVILHQYPQMVAGLADVCRDMGCKTIRWYHNYTDPVCWVEKLARFRGVDWSVFVSAYLRDQIGQSNSLVIHNPVGTGAPINSQQRMRVRELLDTDNNVTVVTSVSRMSPTKGHRKLLEALDLITKHEWVCWIVGGPQTEDQATYYEGLKEFVVDKGLHGRVRFLGLRRDVPDLLAASDLFCHPSLEPEAFGISFVEAMQAGLPIIATKSGAAQEIVGEGSAIFLEDFCDFSLRDALETLISNRQLRQTMALNATRRGEMFRPDRIVPELDSTLQRLAQSTGRE